MELAMNIRVVERRRIVLIEFWIFFGALGIFYHKRELRDSIRENGWEGVHRIFGNTYRIP